LNRVARGRWDWVPFSTSADRTDWRGVDDDPGPVDLVGRTQPCKQHFVQFVPHAGGLPVANAAPAGHAVATAHFAWEKVPARPVWRTLRGLRCPRARQLAKIVVADRPCCLTPSTGSRLCDPGDNSAASRHAISVSSWLPFGHLA